MVAHKEIILPLPLQPEQEDIAPHVANYWVVDSQEWYRIEMKHKQVYPNQSKCDGLVTTCFRHRARGEKKVHCWSCRQEVVLNIGVLQIEIGIW